MSAKSSLAFSPLKRSAPKALINVVLLILIINMLPLSVLAAEPAGATEASDACLEFIKKYEGFSAKVHSDASHYYIGYGTTCSPNDYPNGITEEEAHDLLKQTVQRVGRSLNIFLNRYNITLNQNQYDALLSFTYNLGTSWTGYTNRLRTILIEGVENYTDVEIADAMGIWCHIGKDVNKQLLNRRISEARMFLYGDYGTGDSPNFKYLILDPGDGEVKADVVLFESNKHYGPLPTAELNGFTFLGWYTDNDLRIQSGFIVEKNYEVSAKWAKGTVEVPPDDPPVELPPAEEPPEDEEPQVDQPIVENSAEDYGDIAPDAWYYTYVSELIRDNVISGYPDYTFRPDNPTTYGEALKMIILAAGYDEQEASGHWASGYADFAVAEGFIDRDEILGLDEHISRLAVAKITAKALGLPTSILKTPFADTDDSLVLALYEVGIIQGSINKEGTMVFLPSDNIKRSELSAIIWRINNNPDFSRS